MDGVKARSYGNEYNVLNKKTHNRRGWGEKLKRKQIRAKQHEKLFTILGSNANGIHGKLDSLKENIDFFNKPTCINLQETKLRFTGTIKLEGYQIFENVRNGMGGGLLTAVSQDISPILISNGCENVEMLVVQGKIGNYDMRIFNCYGPQEISQSQRPSSEQQQIVTQFWMEIENEVIKAKDEGCLVLIEMDANAKVGKNIINDDPNETSENGKLFLDFVSRQNLKILNASDKCAGVITRHRVTVNRTEESVIDYIVVCDTFATFLEEMVIDEKRIHVLTKYASKKGNRKKVQSDHNILYGKFSLKYNTKKKFLRREIFDFKNKEGQKLFYEATNLTKKFDNCFDHKNPIKENVNRYYKALDDLFHQNFKKIRITSKNSEPKDEKQKELLTKLKLKKNYEITLKTTSCKLMKTILTQQIEDLEEEVGTDICDKNAEKVKEHISEINTHEGKLSQIGFWKLKSKLCPRASDPPMAKKDEHGNLVTAPSQLKHLYAATYKHRLRHREMKAEYKDVFILKNHLWMRRLHNLKQKITHPWTIRNIDKVLKSLKNNQSRDPLGMINEVFKHGIIGNAMKDATLSLMNNIKSFMYVPTNMQLSNITTIFKNKGSRLDMSSDRGIFILPVLRKILDKLTYQDKYPDLDLAMSDSNIGARKNKNIRNHLFIIHGVINSVIQGEDKCVDIQVYDVQQAFDALWLEDSLNDLYDSLPEESRDDKLALVYETNVNNLVAVNTGVGETERFSVPRIVQQGGSWGPMECSNTVDTLGRRCRDRGIHHYLYKKMVRVLPLAMVDDILGIGVCGNKSIALNSYINTHIEMKKLRFHTPDIRGKSKCHKLHIGTPNRYCPELLVHGSPMEQVSKDTYLGDIISENGTNTANIISRVSKGIGILAKIKNILESVSFGPQYFKIALLLRESMLLNGILTNCESWYGLTDTEISQLESVDLQFFRSLFEVPRTVPTAGIYLETGSYRIGTIIKVRRLNFLHYMVKLKKSEMLSKFFHAQWENPVKFDWVLDVKQNLEEFELPSSLEAIQAMSTFQFKSLVKKRVKQYELAKLLELKEEKANSKMRNLTYLELKIQDYLLLKAINIKQSHCLNFG